MEGEPQVSPGVASLPVASGVREHIVGIANRFQTQAFMQRYTCLPRHTIVGDCARLGLFFVAEQVYQVIISPSLKNRQHDSPAFFFIFSISFFTSNPGAALQHH
ncbi:hypothetical protein [Janthinobacterium sp. UMAB-56]|uniref:hypothetical protein n=1 Tax=Janthinobacterium sp. UMAB-56 TaxID=1365361 RepID=UPI001C589392|nr:hypothetical protein [Janthinobacterium sp. UMAB-56]